MGQTNRKFDDETKMSIKKAVWTTYRCSSNAILPSEYIGRLFGNIKREFLLEDCFKTPFVRGCSPPDIVIKGKGVIEVRNAHVSSSYRDQIEKYVQVLSLAGAQINFQQNGFPEIFWYYLDAADEVKLENIVGETISSDPTTCSRVTRSVDGTSGLSTGAAVGIGILGAAAAIGLMAYYGASSESENVRKTNSARPPIIEDARSNFSPQPKMNFKSKPKINAEPESASSPLFEEAMSNCSLQPNFSTKKKKYTFDEIHAIIIDAATEAKENVNEIYPYRDYLHNQYVNEFCSILHEELHSIGVPFEREKEFNYNGNKIYPDIYINGIAVVEVKAKNKKKTASDDKKQIQKYVAATGLRGILVNFGHEGVPTVKVTEVE